MRWRRRRRRVDRWSDDGRKWRNVENRMGIGRREDIHTHTHTHRRKRRKRRRRKTSGGRKIRANWREERNDDKGEKDKM